MVVNRLDCMVVNRLDAKPGVAGLIPCFSDLSD